MLTAMNNDMQVSSNYLHAFILASISGHLNVLGGPKHVDLLHAFSVLGP